LFEGVPPHLVSPLAHWIRGQLGDEQRDKYDPKLMMRVAAMAHIPLAPELTELKNYISERKLQRAIVEHCTRNEGAFLDAIDATVYATKGRSATSLRRILEEGGSAYTIAKNGTALQHRVDGATQEAADLVMAGGDHAAMEMREAWTAAFGRNPDGSDAWDHSIKAVEAALIPIVVPVKTRPRWVTSSDS
jgi:hypothetical protein